jgi:hypothetical protein
MIKRIKNIGERWHKRRCICGYRRRLMLYGISGPDAAFNLMQDYPNGHLVACPSRTEPKEQ